jgi:Aspartyl protease
MHRKCLVAIIAIVICEGRSVSEQLPMPRKVATPERGPEPRLLASPPEKAIGLGLVLLSQGYTAVPLERGSFDQHDAVRVAIGDKKCRLVIDTGAPLTSVDRERLKGLKLEWHGSRARKWKADELFDMSANCNLPEVTIGGFSINGVCAYSFNAAPWNDRAGTKEDLMDGVLGMDVLYSAGAVIDLPGRTLYLKKTKVEFAAVNYVNRRDLQFPLEIDRSTAMNVKRIRIFVSDDRGRSWCHDKDYEPDARAAVFKAPHDGEYWFAVQTEMTDGSAEPIDLAKLSPLQKVRVSFERKPVKTPQK